MTALAVQARRPASARRQLCTSIAPKVCAARFEPVTAAAPRTLFLFDSQSGDVVGGGRARVFSPENSRTTSVSIVFGSNPKSVRFSLAAVNALGRETWDFQITAPNNAALQTNTVYSAALGSATLRPGLRVFGQGICTDSGRFIVRELVFSGNTLVRAAIDIEHHCGPASDPALFGAVRDNSTVDLFPFDGVYPTYRLSLTPPPHGSLVGGGLNCGSAAGPCVLSPASPVAVTLTPVPDPGYLFAGLNGDCAIETSSTIRVNSVATGRGGPATRHEVRVTITPRVK
jgi:hypothetical protein